MVGSVLVQEDDVTILLLSPDSRRLKYVCLIKGVLIIYMQNKGERRIRTRVGDMDSVETASVVPKNSVGKFFLNGYYSV